MVCDVGGLISLFSFPTHSLIMPVSNLVEMLNTNTYGNPARTEMTDTDTEDRGVHGGVKGAASTYVLCPHLTDGAFQFKRGRGRQERSG